MSVVYLKPLSPCVHPSTPVHTPHAICHPPPQDPNPPHPQHVAPLQPCNEGISHPTHAEKAQHPQDGSPVVLGLKTDRAVPASGGGSAWSGQTSGLVLFSQGSSSAADGQLS